MATSTHTTGESWGGLRKAWKGYRIAKAQGDDLKMRLYARRIRKIQEELGVLLTEFPNLSIDGATRTETEIAAYKKLESELAGGD